MCETEKHKTRKSGQTEGGPITCGFAVEGKLFLKLIYSLDHFIRIIFNRALPLTYSLTCIEMC